MQNIESIQCDYKVIISLIAVAIDIILQFCYLIDTMQIAFS